MEDKRGSFYRPGDITREEFHRTIHNWLETYRPLRKAHLKNDESEIVIPFAPGKFKEYWTNKLLGVKESAAPAEHFAIYALDYHNNDNLEIIMKNGVNPCAAMDFKTGRTMLQYAVMKGDIKKVQYMLHYCSVTGINARDKEGRTAYYLSINVPIYFHSLLITKALFARNAKVDIPDNRGQTPLHRACILGEILFVQELLFRGAPVDIKDCQGRVPLECCKLVSFRETVAALIRQRRRTRKNTAQERSMWASIISKSFVKNLFKLLEQSCPTCKQGYTKCNSLKKESFRRWYLVHRVAH